MPCEAAKPAIVAYCKQLGRKLTVCTDKHCPYMIHKPQQKQPPTPFPGWLPPEVETENEAAQRAAVHEERMAEYKAEQERREESRRPTLSANRRSTKPSKPAATSSERQEWRTASAPSNRLSHLAHIQAPGGLGFLINTLV
jgi:hypothetical protein